MENNIKIEKIHIVKLIESLIYLHNAGADYVDIVGETEDKEDTLFLNVREEYLCSEDEREIISIANPLYEDDMDDEQYFNEIS